jgi:hypothetical protein
MQVELNNMYANTGVNNSSEKLEPNKKHCDYRQDKQSSICFVRLCLYCTRWSGRLDCGRGVGNYRRMCLGRLCMYLVYWRCRSAKEKLPMDLIRVLGWGGQLPEKVLVKW